MARRRRTPKGRVPMSSPEYYRGESNAILPVQPELDYVDWSTVKLTVSRDGVMQGPLKSDRPIVGLVGRKRVGKDTVAARLVDKHGYVRLAFADRLKDLALSIDPLVGSGFPPLRLSEVVGRWGWEKAKDDPEVRRFLQYLGTSVRGVDRNFWVRPVREAMGRTLCPVVITDVRFNNEADAIEAAGGILVRVIRPGVDDGDKHVSETELDNRYCPFTLHNHTTIGDLNQRVDAVARVVQHAVSSPA